MKNTIDPIEAIAELEARMTPEDVAIANAKAAGVVMVDGKDAATISVMTEYAQDAHDMFSQLDADGKLEIL